MNFHLNHFKNAGSTINYFPLQSLPPFIFTALHHVKPTSNTINKYLDLPL